MQRGSKAIAGLYFPGGVISSTATPENNLDTSPLHHNANSVTTMSPCATPRKVWSKSEVNVLSNIPGSPKIVSKSPDVSKLSATRRQIYDKVRSMRESPINDNTVLSQPRKFLVKQGRVSKWTEGQQKSIIDSGVLERNRVTSEEIRQLLPTSITECFSDSQIRTRLAYERFKLKK